MYLKELHIKGFKSFPKAISLEFSKGISAIIGPNGCGKTNVMDAIRWVLGEQKTSALRSDRMSDIIFKGTQTRKPMAAAEVSIVLGEAQGLLPNDPRRSEITITRQMLYSGEGSYFINNQPCRLKDITRMLMDTGIGISFYSLIERSMIDKILGGNPADRRAIFEEAAQIMKYKMDKHTTELKLESTKQARAKIQIQIDEKKLALKELKGKVGQAKRYQKLEEQLVEIMLKIKRNRYHNLEQQQSALAKEKDDHLSKSLIKQNRINELEIEKADLELQKGQVDHEVRQTSQAQMNISSDLLEQNSLMHKKMSRIDLLKQNIETTETQIGSTKFFIDKFHKDLKENFTNIENFKKELDELEDDLGRITAEGDECSEKLLQINNLISQEEEKVAKDETLYSVSMGELNAIESELNFLTQNKTELGQKKNRVINSITELETLLSGLEKDHASIGAELQRFEKKSSDLQVDKTKLEQMLKELEQEINQLNLELSSNTERLKLVKEIGLQSMEDQKGTDSLMKDPGRWGLKGRLSELMTVQSDYASGLDTYLGELAGALVSTSLQKSLQALQYLSKQGGKTTIIIPDQLPSSSNTSSFNKDIAVNAEDVVEVNEEVRGLKKLVSRLWIFKDGSGLPDGEAGHLDWVTINGEYCCRNGILSGGAREHHEIGPFQRKQEEEKLQRARDVITKKGDELRSQKEINLHKLSSYDEELLKLSGDIARLEKDKNLINNNISQKRYEFELYRNDKKELEGQLQEIALKKQELEKRESDKKALTSSLSKTLNDFRAKKKQLEKEYEELRIAEREIDHRRGSLDVKRVGLKGQLLNSQREIERLQLEIESREKSIVQKQEQLVSWKEEEVRLKGELEDVQAEIDRYFKLQDTKEAELSQLQSKQDDLAKKISELGLEVVKAETEKKQIDQKINDIDKELLKINLDKDNLCATAKSEYGVELDKMDPIVLSSKDEYELNSEAEKFRNQLSEIGTVSSSVFVEYEDKKNKLDELEKQAGDLDEAAQMLYNTIKRLNKEAISNFRATFEQTKDCFKEIFSTLFEGGEGDLTLEDESDPLNSNIDILARPSGKRFLGISQLSGGETALTAIALLFSLYMVKPSPFCLLDEVDAPLDDANVNRLLKLLQEFSKKTQYVMITHNRRTMEVADYLYGITMEEKGVSKVVSVKVSDLKLDLDD
ncbi:chromosome segregation protein SMC [bacterium]|nr:chromosome segregation protein SMC [bacterium]